MPFVIFGFLISLLVHKHIILRHLNVTPPKTITANTVGYTYDGNLYENKLS